MVHGEQEGITTKDAQIFEVIFWKSSFCELTGKILRKLKPKDAAKV